MGLLIELQSEESDSVTPPSSDFLDQLSPLFEVKQTPYGGRGCFAVSKIPKGTTVLRCDRPIGFAVTKDFKKEVCNWCFSYDNGRVMKVRKSGKKGKYSINFCSESCLQAYEKNDPDGVLSEILLQLESFDIQEDSESVLPGLLTTEIIDYEWKKVEEWTSGLPKKASKRLALTPRAIDEDVYVELRYLASVALELHRGASQEIKYFNILQSNEYEKIIKYPHMLNTAINVYKLLKLIFPPTLQTFITEDFVRKTLGKENGNAFGIWSAQLNDEYQEYMGFCLYPSASFFNHSCAPSLKKIRQGASFVFETLRDIELGEELYISYGSVTEESFKTRKETLKEWFFECACTRCQQEEVVHDLERAKLC